MQGLAEAEEERHAREQALGLEREGREGEEEDKFFARVREEIKIATVIAKRAAKPERVPVSRRGEGGGFFFEVLIDLCGFSFVSWAVYFIFTFFLFIHFWHSRLFLMIKWDDKIESLTKKISRTKMIVPKRSESIRSSPTELSRSNDVPALLRHSF
jgi:hypothetical protein